MIRSSKTSSLLAKYSLMYEKKPRSRVFAPLAETYRKLGMLDEALKILKEGIRNHPSYTLGYIVLGSCYFDLQNYEIAYNTIRPFVSQNLENITLQKLFAKTCINLGHLEEALQTFKYLLLLNPKDQYVADQIKLLEDDLLVSSETDDFGSSKQYTEQEFSEDDWVQVNFSNDQEEEKTDQIEDWSVSTSPLDQFKNEVQSSEIELPQRDLDDRYFYEEYDNEADNVLEEEKEVEDSSPIITHTLVDLYCSQGHFDRAKLILENILELHPSDEATKKKLLEIQFQSSEIVDEEKEDDTMDKISVLFDLFQTKLKEKSQKIVS